MILRSDWKIVPCYIITSYQARDYFQALRNISASAAPMVPKVPWLLCQNECLVPNHIGLENHTFFYFPLVFVHDLTTEESSFK